MPINTAVYAISIAAIAATGLVWGLRAHSLNSTKVVPGHSVALVELFTSEGCSSCPPADELLGELVKSGENVVALEEHVDYWNQLGWFDPYSSAAFSQRQQRYSRTLGVDGVYTPQMIVNGREEFVGSDENRARGALKHAADLRQAAIKLSFSNASLSVDVSNVPEATEIWLAITEDGLRSNVARGENSGRVLAHTAVVRRLKSVGSVRAGGRFSQEIPVTLDSSWDKKRVKLVVFAQQSGQGPVVGASAVSLD